jgi:hypothetical protein
LAEVIWLPGSQPPQNEGEAEEKVSGPMILDVGGEPWR